MLRFFFVILVLLGSPVLAAELQFTLEEQAASIAGATPAGEVLWFSVERVPTGHFVAVNIRRQSTKADLAGGAEIRFDDGVPARSVWAAIDLATGSYALASPSSDGLLEDPFEPGAFRTDAEGAADQVRHDHKLVEALWVRPGDRTAGAGSWRLRAADGGPHDADATHDGHVSLRAESLKPVADEALAPELFAPGDVVVLIDPTSLEISAARLEEERPEEGGGR